MKNKGNERFKKVIKNYKKLGTKEFFKRWGKGIEGITPLQQTRTSLIGSLIVIIGIIWGIIVTLITRTWWMVVILVGSLIMVGMSLIGTYQKYRRFKIQEELIKQMNKK